MGEGEQKQSLAHKATWGYLWNQGFRLIQFGLGFVLTIIIARYLGPQLQGDYATITSYGFLLILIITLGFDDTLNRYTAKHSSEIGVIKGIFFHMLRWRLVIAMGAGLVLFILAPQISEVFARPYLSFYFRLTVPVVFITVVSSLFENLFIGRLKMKALTIVRLLGSGLNLALVFYLLYLGYGITAIMLVTFGVSVISFCVLVYLSQRELAGLLKSSPMKPVYIFSMSLWLNNGINFILSKQIDVLFLSIFALPSDKIAFYHIGVGLAVSLNMLLYSGLFGVSLAALSEAYAKGGYELLRRGWSTIIKLGLVLSVPAFAFLIFNADVLITRFYGKDYTPSIILFQVFSYIIIFMRILGGGVHITTLYAVGRERLALILRAISGGFNIVLALVLIPFFGVWGALYATALATVLVISLELFFTRRIIQGKFPLSFTLKVLAAVAVGLIPSFILPSGSFLWFFIRGIAFLLIFGSLVYLAKPLEESDLGLLDKAFPKMHRFFALFSR